MKLSFSRCWHCLKPLTGTHYAMRSLMDRAGNRRIVHEACEGAGAAAMAAMVVRKGAVPQ